MGDPVPVNISIPDRVILGAGSRSRGVLLIGPRTPEQAFAFGAMHAKGASARWEKMAGVLGAAAVIATRRTGKRSPMTLAQQERAACLLAMLDLSSSEGVRLVSGAARGPGVETPAHHGSQTCYVEDAPGYHQSRAPASSNRTAEGSPPPQGHRHAAISHAAPSQKPVEPIIASPEGTGSPMGKP